MTYLRNSKCVAENVIKFLSDSGVVSELLLAAIDYLVESDRRFMANNDIEMCDCRAVIYG